MVYGETGKKPLMETIKSRMVCFWHKISVCDNNKLSTKILTFQKKLHEQNLYNSPWLKKIENILNSCGMRNVWMNPEVFNSEWLKKALDLRLSDMYKQEWQNTLANKSSCILYKTFKTDMKLENYLLLLDNAERINLCKFRCRNTKTPVVLLGYAVRNIPYENRICSLCNMNEIGDEYHYLLKCTYFEMQRNRYISNFYRRNPNMLKFSLLMQNNDANILKNLSKFISIINLKFR